MIYLLLVLIYKMVFYPFVYIFLFLILVLNLTYNLYFAYLDTCQPRMKRKKHHASPMHSGFTSGDDFDFVATWK